MISEKKWIEIENRLQALGLDSASLEETFILSSKSGGQNVNKTSSCVRLKHIPTGIEVKCERYRSQNENRYHARKLLIEKYEEHLYGKSSPKQKKILKAQKQKKRRERKSSKKYSDGALG